MRTDAIAGADLAHRGTHCAHARTVRPAHCCAIRHSNRHANSWSNRSPHEYSHCDPDGVSGASHRGANSGTHRNTDVLANHQPFQPPQCPPHRRTIAAPNEY